MGRNDTAQQTNTFRPAINCMPDEQLQRRTISSDLIDYVVSKIVQGVQPKQIILFGSYGRGDATPESDLDLFVVHDSQASNRDVRRHIEHLLWGRLFSVDLIVRRPEEIAQNLADQNPFYTHHLLGEGKVLYERPAKTSN